jgi:phosphoserine phosphatase RsbX
MDEMDYYLVKRPLSRIETECGDTGVVMETDGQYFLALVDVLGHGREAHQVAGTAERYLMEHCRENLVAILRGLHACLSGTRGAVVGLCHLNPAGGDLKYVGMGNISVRVLGPGAFRFVPKDGIVGFKMTTPVEETRKFCRGDVLVMCSDGVKDHFDASECAGLLTGTAKSIAVGLLNLYGRDSDDASCLVMRYKHDRAW